MVVNQLATIWLDNPQLSVAAVEVLGLDPLTIKHWSDYYVTE